MLVHASPYDQQRIDRDWGYLQSRLEDWPANATGPELESVRKRFAATIQALTEALDSKSEDLDIAWRLGECYRMGNNIDVDKQYVADAKRYLDRALEINANYVPAYISLGKLVIQAYRKMLFEKQGEVPWELVYVAEEYFQAALERSGAFVDPVIYKGLSYIPYYSNSRSSVENLDEAIALGRQYLDVQPEDTAFARTFKTYKIKRQLIEERTTGQDESLVILPPGYEKGPRYPVVVFLPRTGASALSGFMRYMPVMELIPFILVLPPGKGSSADHSWEGFSACIDRYETYIEDALLWTRKNHSIDETRIVLAGFSLGGDLSWALSMRNPEQYCGSVMMGTRCGYNASEETLKTLSNRDFRGYFLTGDDELPARYEGINKAHELFEASGIKTMHRKTAGGHVSATVQEFKEALEFILQ